MRSGLALAAAALAATLAACGGGNSGSAYTPPAAPALAPTAAPTLAATTAPAITPTAAPAPAPIPTAQLAGAPGFVSAAGRTVYVFDLDTNNVSNCSGGCAAAWPPVSPPAGALSAPWSAISRSDGTRQLAFNGHPLYVFVGDVGNGTTNGDNLVEFGATWHVARPALNPAAVAQLTPAPTAPPNPGSGY